MATAKAYFENTTVRLAILVVVLVLISAASMLAVLYHSSMSAARDSLASQQETNTTFIYHQVELYQDIVDQLAQRIRVKNLLNVGSDDDGHDWSLELRSQLPNNVGLMLVRPGMEILGDPRMLKVGPACVADLHQLERHRPIATPPVHINDEHMAHFDVVAHVQDADGQGIGMVFASFRLDILQRTLDSLARPGQSLEIYDSQGRLLVSSDQAGGHRTPIEQAFPIRNTDWTLVSRSTLQPEDAPTRQPEMVATLVITITLVLCVGGFAWHTYRKSLRD